MERYKISEGAVIYYVTFSVTQWLPIFVRQQPCMIVVDSLNHCIREKGLLVGAYVLMPTHLHAVIGDRDEDVSRLAGTVNDLRKFTGRELANWCDQHGPEAFRRATREDAGEDRDRRIWQPSKHPEAVRSEEFLNTKIGYMHQNPVRAGLVRQPEHWRFSSAGWYASGGEEEADVSITWLAW